MAIEVPNEDEWGWMKMNKNERSWMNFFVFDFLGWNICVVYHIGWKRFKRLMDEIIKIAL